MTPDGFRKLALRLPDTREGEHMDHPDFRVNGRIFATIHPDPAWGVVLLTPRQQKEFVRKDPKAFFAVPGGWGRQGGTKVLLKAVKSAALSEALKLAWLNKTEKTP